MILPMGSDSSLGIILFIILFLLLLIPISLFILWVWMFIDAIKRNEEMWIILFILGMLFAALPGWVVAVLYYFMVYKKKSRKKRKRK